ncbi:ferrochelatase 2 [Thiohalobacter sp. COW1]|uniref:Ferrochelatase n=1 Tax=Thiohalobacter thiocyanaticus TaxID=585455 RepID=A0A1Z4VTJ0_9GAMM|nr:MULTISPECIES: ferrochelatase [Thiohalobacter]BAZ94959.1 protoheme ferro-lyase [Thiohalobacter thiocyanaticus]BCO33128.1 ferrochelatase 2 [Thiohalobacter sp. COW1]
MNRYLGETDFHHDAHERLGVLITNLGTPTAPTPRAVRRYLAEFLWDPRVVEIPRPLWWLILHGVILRFRPGRVAHAYASVWEEDGSPLLNIARRQREALESQLLARLPGPVKVSLGMRYGEPSLAEALEELRQANARRIVVLPLYPHYSASTTASTFDAVTDILKRWRWVPSLRFVTHYHDQHAYIEALATSVREHWEAHGRDNARLLMSFHGLPRRYLDQGDPYHCQCHKTARLLAEALQLNEDQWQLAFQSRFGREEWLKPYTDATLKEWAETGVERVQVICPGFSADCLETLEEIQMQNKALFLEHGGKRFEYIPALNERTDHIEALTQIVCNEVSGWPEAGNWSSEAYATMRQGRLRRAKALGAER